MGDRIFVCLTVSYRKKLEKNIGAKIITLSLTVFLQFAIKNWKFCKGMYCVNLNNKRLMQGYISSMCVCLWLCLSALDLRNGGTYEYQIWTANSCDDTGESEVILFKYFDYFWNKLQFTKYQSFLYISKTVNRTNSKFWHSIVS